MMYQEISAGAISPQMPPCKAIVINVGAAKEICPALKELHSFQEYTVNVANTSLSKIAQVLDRCREVGVPAIVNCGEELPEPSVWHPGTKYAAALISPGSYHSLSATDILSYIVNDENADTFSNIGYQGYRYDPQILHKLQSRYFEDMRLGSFRDGMSLCEPLVRNCQYAFIDMRSVRYSDYPYSNEANPNGMYAEEICTAARYIGLSKEIRNIFIFGQNHFEKQLTVCNKLVSEVIWHICEGIASNIAEDPENQPSYEYFQRKMVSMGENGETITFLTSYTTKRWWMEVPSKEGKNTLVPCSINDYQCACAGEIPLRWLFFYQKQTL